MKINDEKKEKKGIERKKKSGNDIIINENLCLKGRGQTSIREGFPGYRRRAVRGGFRHFRGRAAIRRGFPGFRGRAVRGGFPHFRGRGLQRGGVNGN